MKVKERKLKERCAHEGDRNSGLWRSYHALAVKWSSIICSARHERDWSWEARNMVATKTRLGIGVQ